MHNSLFLPAVLAIATVLIDSNKTGAIAQTAGLTAGLETEPQQNQAGQSLKRAAKYKCKFKF